MGRGGTAHPRPESAFSVGLHHDRAREGEERGGLQKMEAG